MWPLLGFALVWPTVAACIYFPGAISSGALAMTLYALSKTLQFSLPLLFLWLNGLPIRAPQLHFRGLPIGIGFGLLVGGGTLALYYGGLRGSQFLKDTPQELQAKMHSFGLDSPPAFILAGVFLSVIHSLAEEYYWRWFAFGQLQERISFVLALSISSLAFMAHHVVVLSVYFPGRFWSATLPLSLTIAGGGVVWACLYHYTRSIYAAWLSHLLVDAAIMVVGYDMLF